MATSPSNNKTNSPAANVEQDAADPSEVKRKLAWRMGFAGLMIVGLLGALALFDRLSAPGESEPAAPQFTEPVPVAKKVITQPLTPAEPAPEPVKEAEPPPAPEVSAAPVDKSAPRVDRPPRTEAAAPSPAAPRTAAPSTPPATRAAAAPRTAAPAVNRSEAPARAEAPVAAEPPSPPRLFSGYALQAGVFSDTRRAEELHARLVLEGIPATIESRVQVGPFRNRAEAEAMREKMKAMGIDTVLLPPKGSRR